MSLSSATNVNASLFMEA